MWIELKITLIGCLLALTITLPLRLSAQSHPIPKEEAAIRATFHKWAADFNARDSQHVCDLFASDLRWVTLFPSYNEKGVDERNYKALCNILQRTISDKTKQYRYATDIKEVIVSGNLAVVRVVWTLTTTNSARPQETNVTKEFSLDIVQKQPNASWKIIRFYAYEMPVPSVPVTRGF